MCGNGMVVVFKRGLYYTYRVFADKINGVFIYINIYIFI